MRPRVCAAWLRRWIGQSLRDRQRAWTFAEIVWDAGMDDFPRPLIWSALRILVDRDELRTVNVLTTRIRSGFRVGRVEPVFWHSRWPMPKDLRLVDPPIGGGAEHG